MSNEYSERKVSEALRLSGNNTAKARRQIQAWFYEDPKLLLELTRPHWNGIVAYAVDRAVGRAMRGEDTPQPREDKKAKKAPAKESNIGKEMLRSFVSEHAAQFGHEISRAEAPASRKAASQTHVDAIHLMAAKSKQKPKKR
ncbi:MAG: hypothetical protein KGQ41_07055 [Alphaproteobacteria bacterium]|nr:hypothetical protein [Alphaproteobacteria bacterium]